VIDLSSIGSAKVIEGIPASPGIVMGKAFILDTERPHVPDDVISVDEVESEISAFRSAIDDTKKELLAIRKDLDEVLGEDHARIFDAHLMILEDAMVVEGSIRKVREHQMSAAVALTDTIGQVTKVMSRTDDEYLRERIVDIKDIERRVLLRLLGRKPRTLAHLDEDVVVVAHTLAPADTASMHRERVTGFATEAGGRTSHAAIMARSLEIPAVVGLRGITDLIRQGEPVIVDGTSGALVYGYDDAVLEYYRDQKRQYEEFERRLLLLKDYPAVTRDGREFRLGANIEIPDEVESALAHGAEGIGLFRTEYLFIARDDVPSEDEQYEAYRRVAEAMAPSMVVIRTLDVGGDKFGPHGAAERESNPFLGWRGIRYSLCRPDLFIRQLKAILRASAHGKISLMFPMIASVHEIRDAKQVLEAARQELAAEGRQFDASMRVGIMVETPAAAATADFLAEDVDFFSVGSNDLIQYVLAVDRGNDRVAYLYDQYHPAVLRMIRDTVRAARRHRKWVGLCGEMAGDPLAVMLLIGLGLNGLSTSPLMLPEVKHVIRSSSYNYARKIVARALGMRTGSEVRRYLEQIFRKKFPESTVKEMET